MVDYAEEADFIGHKKPKKYLSAADAKARREARNAARSEADWRQYAREAIYRLLGVRDRSTHELEVALQQREVPAVIASETIARFVDAGLVNDAAFAASYVRARFAAKTTSRRALAAELKKKGISPDDSEAALAQLDACAESQAAIDFAMHKVRSMRGLDHEVARRRLYGALGRRGFGAADIRTAVEQALDELRRLTLSD